MPEPLPRKTVDGVRTGQAALQEQTNGDGAQTNGNGAQTNGDRAQTNGDGRVTAGPSKVAYSTKSPLLSTLAFNKARKVATGTESP